MTDMHRAVAEAMGWTGADQVIINVIEALYKRGFKIVPLEDSPATPPTRASVVLFRRNFWAAPEIMSIHLSEPDAMTAAWKLAKSKWRYTGAPREEYTYFDQQIKVAIFPLRP